jgi:hypothetical protein
MNEMPESNRYVIDKNGKIIERKKKGRMYSLGGNEPKKSHLVRMKTVGTFDLCMEVTALACGFNQDILTIPKPQTKIPEEVIEEESRVLSSIEAIVHPEKYDSEDTQIGSISSPKRQRHISSSENSLAIDDSSNNSNSKKKFRSLSTSPYLIGRNSEEFRCKSADLLSSSVENYDEILATATSASEIRNKSDNDIFEMFKNESETEIKTSDDDFSKLRPTGSTNLPTCVRRRTFKKSRKIVRTDSEMFKEQILSNATIAISPVKRPNSIQVSKTSSMEGSEKYSREDSPKNISTDTVFSDMCEEEQIDLEKLEIEYKEHVKSNLQREYKSDGDSLDEIGKERLHLEWKNQSVDFEFLEDDKVNELRVKSVKKSSMKKIRNDSESRTKSEGDKDTLYSKADSTETQSTEDENKIEVDPQSESNKVEKHQSLFEKRFGKLKKMNKLLKVKRFSTSALYDKKKTNESSSKGKESQPPVISALSQVSDFASSKTSLASPKSLKGKRFLLKKRKFSFFGKSQSNNDLNLNLKSLASKLSLLSKSNFDLSKNSSNLRLNAVGMYGKYGSSNEYRSDIITSPLSEAFYNATGSYQLTPMELFEKFCSQDFTGLYKHETISEDDDQPEAQSYKGAIKKSSSLRKSTLLKQNSEPKFNTKTYPLDQFYVNPQEVFEEEDIESAENEEDEYEYNLNDAMNRRSSYSRQLEFDRNDQYYEEDNEDQYYISENPELYRNADEEIDEIYLMPDKQGRYDGCYMRNSEEILAIDETDEDSEDLLEENEVAAESEEELNEKEKLLALYDICPKDDDGFSDIEGNSEDREGNLKTIITEYVKNAQSMDLLSDPSETLKSNSNSEYAFDTVKQINLDSCSTSKLSLSLNSDIFDDITLAAPTIDNTKTIQICEMDDFTLTPDGSMSENNEGKIAALAQVSEQDKIQNELHSQYTIIDCDELEHDNEGEVQRFNDEKSSFAEALNKEFDKLFSRASDTQRPNFTEGKTPINEHSDTLTSTPSVNTSVATVLTAIKMPSRCSMEKLEALPFEFDQGTVIGGISEKKEEKPTTTLLSQSMTSTTLHQSIAQKKEDLGKKSKRSMSVGAIHKRKSNKCTPL